MSLPYTDDFNRADNADLGTTWDVAGTNASFKVLSFAAAPNDQSVDCAEMDNSQSWPQDQYGQATLKQPGTGGVGAGCGIVLRGVSGASPSYYRAVGNGNGYSIQKCVAGSFGAALKSGSGTTFATNDIFYFEAVGSNPTVLTIRKGGAGGTFVDSYSDSSTPLTSGKVGVGYSSNDGGGAAIDLFEGGATGANAVASVVGVASSCAAGDILVAARPPPPYTLSIVTG